MEEINQENTISSFGGLYMNFFCIYLAIQFGQHQQQMMCYHLATFTDILKNYASSILDYFNS
jgi:hypothetical protein